MSDSDLHSPAGPHEQSPPALAAHGSLEPTDGAPRASLFPWLFRSSALSFGLAALLIVLLRNGFSSYDSNEQLLQYAREFPRPTPSYKSSAVLGPALARALDVSTPRAWTLLHASLSVAAGATAVWLLRRRASDPRHGRIALVWLALAPGATCLLQLIGHYDVFVLLGATLLGFSRGAGAALVAGALVGATNPGQACVLLLAYTCVARGLDRAPWRLSWAFAAGFASSAAAIAAWHASMDVAVRSRLSLLLPNAWRGLRGTMIAGTMASYSWYGLAWPLVLAAIFGLREQRRARALLAAGLLVVPALASMLTLDGTRVFVCTAWAGFCYLLADLAQNGERWERRVPLQLMSELVALGALLAPAYVTWVNGHVHSPWWQLWMPKAAP